MGAEVDKGINDPLRLAIYGGNVEIIKYLMKEYSDFYGYKDIYRIVNKYSHELSLDRFSKILNYVNEDGKRLNPNKFKSPKLWYELLGEDYEIFIHGLTGYGSYKFGATVYVIARDANEIIAKYKEDPINNYKYVKERFGKLLDISVNNILGPQLFRYLIKVGAPITSEEGKILARAISIWDIYTLYELNNKRFTM